MLILASLASSSKRASAGLLALLAVAAVVSGCGGSALGLAGRPHGCAAEVLGRSARIEPRSSGLSCARIRAFFGGVPAEPGPFLMSPGPGSATWHCAIATDVPVGSPIIRCRLKGRRFAYVASG